MFSPQNSTVAFVLVFGVLFCWGSWPNFRVLCKVYIYILDCVV